jgi:glycosyltransferase involved in cell wall biosynthesis
MIEALFVNSGLLGLRTFAVFVERAFADGRDGIRATQTVLTDGLSTRERVVRRLLCARLVPDAAGVRNLDRFRYRAELNAGLAARARIRRLEAGGRRFDLLHFHRQPAAYASLARMRTTPSIVSIDCTQRYLVERAATRAEARSYLPNLRRDGEVFDAARLIVSTSEWAARSLRDEYPRCTTDLEVMANPVLLEHFDPAWARERHAAATSSSDYRPRVLFMGGDFARKGGHDLVAAWRAGRFGERARLDLVTHAAVPDAGEADGIHVHAGVPVYSPAWRRLWRGADVFALPTHDEAFGLVFQESAAAGLPSVGTRINAIPELVLEGETGLLVAPGDRGALAAALDRLLASAELRLEMGVRARRHVEATADAEAYRAKLADAIHRLAGR